MIVPDWNAPSHIRAFTTTRNGGVSQAPFNSNNLGMHVGDNPDHVISNRSKIALHLPNYPLWLNQTHSVDIVRHTDTSAGKLSADGSFSTEGNQVCCVMTADCLPVLITNRQGTQVAAVHAGWRGLCDGIIENAVAMFDCPKQDIIVWLGPAIGPDAFEVGEEVVAQFCDKNAHDLKCFTPYHDRYLANIYHLAKNRLIKLGVEDISGGEHCTFSQSTQFYSYRRDGQTGRMASMIWIEK